MELKDRVALRVKTIRKGRGLSQEAMAEMIDRSPDTISNLERGLSIPNYETLDALAKGLKIPVADFFLEEENETPARAEAMARLIDAARQLDDKTLKTAAALVELLASQASD
jgi:transcriptional regulator with XRE-family HTH domain